MNQYYAEFFLMCESASSSRMASTCVGRMNITGEPVFDERSPLRYKTVEENGIYKIDDEGGALRWRSGSVRIYLNKADGRGWCTVSVINSVLTLYASFVMFCRTVCYTMWKYERVLEWVFQVRCKVEANAKQNMKSVSSEARLTWSCKTFIMTCL